MSDPDGRMSPACLEDLEDESLDPRIQVDIIIVFDHSSFVKLCAEWRFPFLQLINRTYFTALLGHFWQFCWLLGLKAKEDLVTPDHR